MSLFSNLYARKTPYSTANLAKIIESTYSDKRMVREFKTKERFSPSSLVYGNGKCPRYWYIAFGGAEFLTNFTPQSVDNMEAGTDGHARIQRNVARTVDCDVELPILYEDPPIHGFCDLRIRFDGYELPVEIKTTRSEVFEWRLATNTPADYHVVQLLIYLKVLGHDYGLIMYENKNDHRKLLIPVRMSEQNRQFVDYLFDWMREVRQAWEDKQLPTKKPRANAKICKECPVRETCDSLPKEGQVDIELLKFDKETLDM